MLKWLIATGLVATAAGCTKTTPPKPIETAAERLGTVFPGTPIVSRCPGNFTGEPNEVAFGLHEPSAKKAVYVVVNSHDVMVLSESIDVATPESIEVQCFTPAAAAEMNTTLSDSEGIHGEIKAGTRDVICTRNPLDETGVSCVRFDGGKFVGAGGWTT